jgi:tetratricopeptide (TPR) repeat protein
VAETMTEATDALKKVRADRTHLHIQLSFPADTSKYARIPDYPWELLHDGEIFLGQDVVAFSRYIENTDPAPTLPTTKTVNVLLVSSEAYDSKNHLRKLPKAERKAIIEGLQTAETKSGTNIKLTILDNPTFDALRKYLSNHRDDTSPHVLHFDGHGFFGRRCEQCKRVYLSEQSQCQNTSCAKAPLSEIQGYLVFEHDDREADYISTAEFGELFRKASLSDRPEQTQGLLVAVLSACKSGMSLGSESVFNGTAQNLIRSGVPAVVAMQYSVRTDAAKAFAEHFYDSLCQKDSLARAVSWGRSAMGTEGNQWYRPVLYLRWRDNEGGQLFASLSQIAKIETETSTPSQLYYDFLYPLPPVVKHFKNRFFATTWVCEFLNNPAERIMIVVGRRGIGKTQMISCAIKRLVGEICPEQPEQSQIKNLNYSISNLGYISPKRTPRIVTRLLDGLCQTLEAEKVAEFKLLCQNSSLKNSDKIEIFLADYCSSNTVIVIDDFDLLIDAETRIIQDQDLEEVLCSIRDFPSKYIKIILITRIIPRKSLLLKERFTLKRVNLGLASPYAEQSLRQRDIGENRISLESDESLRQACKRINGFPRALDALYNMLLVHLEASLADLLSTPNLCSEKYQDIVDVLIGEEFKSLTPSEQQIMQIMAVYNRPILPIAIEQLLPLYSLDINVQDTLGKLIDKQLVKITPETKEYYLEAGDAEYAFSQLELGESSNDDSEVNAPQFTQCSLLNKAANYLRTVREAIRRLSQGTLTIESLVQQVEIALTEFDLRYRRKDYSLAAKTLLEIGQTLVDLGDSSLATQRYESLEGKIRDPLLQSYCQTDLGNAYFDSGEFEKAILSYQRALEIAQETKDLELQGKCLGNLGNCFQNLGNTEIAIEHYRKALGIAQDLENKELQGKWLSNLGICYHNLGRTDDAILTYQQALSVAREIRNQKLEGILLSNLGNCHEDLGQPNQALEYHQLVSEIISSQEDLDLIGQYFCNLGNCNVDLGKLDKAIKKYEQALVVYKSTGNLPLKGTVLHSWSEALTDLGDYHQALEKANEGLIIGNRINSPKLRIENNCALARAYLYSNNLSNAYTSAQLAQQYDVPLERHYALTLLGIICLQQGNQPEARKRFEEALQQANQLIVLNKSNYRAFNTQVLALCGLSLTGKRVRLSDAVKASLTVHRISQDAKGIMQRMLCLLDKISLVDNKGKLEKVQIKIRKYYTPPPNTYPKDASRLDTLI